MKHYYTPYVRNSLRYYTRHLSRPENASFESLCEWDACDRAMGTFNKNQQSVLFEIYRNRDTIADNVYNMSLDLSVPQKKIWRLLEKLEKRVAQERGIEG